MHIPDGFLSNRLALALDAISGATVFVATRRVTLENSGRMIPIMGVMAAFIFAAQMLNFPVLGGTSGHLVGGALLGVLLGPMTAFLTMATVIVAQAVFMQDGGIVALGANLFNIGAMTSFSGYALYRVVAGNAADGRRISVAAFVAGWGSLMLSALCCAVELALAGAIPLKTGLAAMAGYHAIIGIAEGALTAAILAFLWRVRPDLTRLSQDRRLGPADWAGGLILVAIPVLILVLAGSSSLPDPIQGLLRAPEAVIQAGKDPDNLMSSARYREYLEQTGVLVVLVGIAYLTSRLSQRKKGHS